MVTNLNDQYIWVSWRNRLQTGTIIRLCYNWLIAFENRLKSRHLHCLQEQDKIWSSVETNCWFPEQSKNREQRWSTAQVEIGWQPLQDIFKPPRIVARILVFLLIIFFIDSYINVKQESLNYTHSKERFSWKRLGALSQKQAEISDPGCSYIKTRWLLSHIKIPKFWGF